jgi:hypothetical protein
MIKESEKSRIELLSDISQRIASVLPYQWQFFLINHDRTSAMIKFMFTIFFTFAYKK